MESFDESVGRVVRALSKKNILSNSIVLVFSDNGGPTVDLFANTASNWPFRGVTFTFSGNSRLYIDLIRFQIKMTLFEGAVRTFGVVWSDLFRNARTVNTELLHITDWLPTLYEAAGNLKNFKQILHLHVHRRHLVAKKQFTVE